MSVNLQSKAFLTYQFRIQPHQMAEFQTWARDRGMPFWETNDGVLRYRTFRKQSEASFQAHLNGQSAQVHGISQVEAESLEALQRIIASQAFKAIQNEFLSLIDPESLEYSVLECAYDSLQAEMT
jgi:hypothetical protein